MEIKKLQGKVVLILGGNGKVGTGLVKAYLEAGATVIVPGRNEERLSQLKNAVTSLFHDKLHLYVVDTADFKSIKKFSDKIKNIFHKIHHVLSSVGGWWMGKTIPEVTEEVYNEYFIAPLNAHYAFASSFGNLVEEGGSYIFIQGNTVANNTPQLSLMSMQGAAVKALFQSFASEMNHRIRVNTLVLGPLSNPRSGYRNPNGITADEVGSAAVAISISNRKGISLDISDKTKYEIAMSSF